MTLNSVVGQPMVNAGTLYINGMRLFWISGTEISVSSGACREINNENDIVLPAIQTILTTFQGPGGLDIGTIADSTFYAVYAIGSSLYAQPAVDIQMQQIGGVIIAAPLSTTTNNSPPSAILSTSFTAPVLPFGYDMYRRIGTVLTSAGGAILEFWQTGSGTAREMWYDVALNVLTAGVSAAYAAVNLDTAIPAAVGSTDVTFNVLLTPTAAGDTVNLRPTGSASTNGLAIMSGDATAVIHEDSITVPCAINVANSDLSVDYKVVGAVTLNVTSYIDNL